MKKSESVVCKGLESRKDEVQKKTIAPFHLPAYTFLRCVGGPYRAIIIYNNWRRFRVVFREHWEEPAEAGITIVLGLGNWQYFEEYRRGLFPPASIFYA